MLPVPILSVHYFLGFDSDITGATFPSMSDTVQKTINGVPYLIGTLSTTKGIQVWISLLQLMGPGLAEALAQRQALPRQALAVALRDVVLRLDESTLTQVRLAYGEVCVRAGQLLSKDAQELAFAGKIGEMVQWLVAATEHNYADFFDYARNAFVSALDTPPSPPPATAP